MATLPPKKCGQPIPPGDEVLIEGYNMRHMAYNESTMEVYGIRQSSAGVRGYRWQGKIEDCPEIVRKAFRKMGCNMWPELKDNEHVPPT